jgi:hypothetical protein
VCLVSCSRTLAGVILAGLVLFIVAFPCRWLIDIPKTLGSDLVACITEQLLVPTGSSTTCQIWEIPLPLG